jgi:putative CocE/NonD family hydrolase
LLLLLVAGLGVSLLSCSSAPDGASVSRTGYITVSGGVKLAYDLTLPAATGRFPVALEYDDYTVGADNGASVAGSDAGLLLAAGFAVLGVNMPGSGCSGGINNIADVDEWAPAGAQVVEWAAAQPWSTGHVGMFGSSMPGITQIGVASLRPKGLDAITPFHIATDIYRDVAYPGGVYNARFLNFYAAHLVTVDAQTARGAIRHGNRQCIGDFRAHVPLNRRYAINRNAVANPFEDSYWRTSPGEHARRIDIPILGCQSWQDGVVSSRATELYYDTFKPKTTWFIGMNGGHGSCEFSQPFTMMLSFLRHYVAGVNNDWQKTPHITILHDVSGGTTSPPAPAWTSTYNSWPALMKPVTLYFQPGSALAAGPATAAGQSSYSGPAPSQSGRWAASPQPGSSVSYTSPPLARTVDFFGPGSVNVWLSSTARDTDVEVILSEVRPDGKAQYVQAGWLDVAQRALAPTGSGAQQSTPLRPYQTHALADRRPLTPGVPVYARVELFPFEHVFRKGSSIQVTIDSAMGPAESTGLWGLTGLAGRFTDTIYASPVRQSQVVLGLIPRATAKAPLPACGTIAGEPCRRNTVPVPHGSLTIPRA